MQTPIQWVSEAPSLGIKWLGNEADHSPPSSAKLKNALSYTFTPQYTFMAWFSVKKSTGTTLSLPLPLSSTKKLTKVSELQPFRPDMVHGVEDTEAGNCSPTMNLLVVQSVGCSIMLFWNS
jgi:hypothetical protein